MKTLEELRAKYSETIEKMESMIGLADEEERDLTEEEETEYTNLDNSIDKLKGEIARREKLEAEKVEAATVKRAIPLKAATNKADNPEEFKNLAEFVHSIRFNPYDPRLEGREQSMDGSGAEGGFMVPTQFRPQLLQVEPQSAVFRPRSNVIPAGSPPDSEVSMPALQQDADSGMQGGIVTEWIAEGQTKPETDMKLKEVSLKPNEVAAHIILTDKLLRNWTSAQAVVSNLMRRAIVKAEEDAFYNGDGIGKPIGILQSGARIDYARATASEISYADIVGMYARLRMIDTNNLVWIASQTCIPQLANIADSGSNNLWVQNAGAGLPPSLLGIPVFFHERSVALGTAGDLVLADLSYYLIKDGSGPYVDASPHVYFTRNKTVIKVFWNVDGKMWLDEPIPLEGSTSNTVGPVIVLN